MKNREKRAFSRETRQNLLPCRQMSATPSIYQVNTEARGAHWIAWVTRGGETTPERSVIVIAATQAEAEARGKQWGEQTRY